MTPPRDTSVPLRVLAVGDIGRTTACHVGDDAMLEGFIETARAIGIAVDWTVMSAEPARSSSAWGVQAVPRLMFEDCAGAEQRDARLAAVDRVLALDPVHWASEAPVEWRASLAAIAECDAVLLAGGGNLSRSWPHEVYERAAVVRAARRAGRAVGISGQTLGPFFDDRTHELTAELLRHCSVVGLREASSYALALELGVSADCAVLQFDDAMGVRAEPPGWWAETGVNGPFIAVTCNLLGDLDGVGDAANAIGRLLAEVSRRTGAAIVIVPHVGDLPVPGAGARPAGHDIVMAQRLAAMAGDDQTWRITPLPSPSEAMWLTAQAGMVISARYHPVVFGAATATPALFLSQDHYTFVKGAGALDLVGLGSWTMPVHVAAVGGLVPAALELWERRVEVRTHLQRLAPAMAQRTRRHVERVLTALSSGMHVVADDPMPSSYGPVARGSWVEAARETARRVDVSAYAEDLQRRLSAADVYVGTLSQELSRKEAGLVAAGDAVAALEREVGRKEAELRTAHAALEALTQSTREAHAEWAADRAALVAHRDQAERRAAAATAAESSANGSGASASLPIHVCTIIARNYLPAARVFSESLRAIHPDAHITVLIVDGPGDPSDAVRFRVLQLEDVLPDQYERRRHTFMYDVTELSTAVKALLLRYLLAEGPAAVLYFDPDIEFFGPVDELWHLAAAHQIVLTPHVLTPIPDDGYEITELAVLRAGVFNLGFVGVGAGATEFLSWWSERLSRHCVSDPDRGLFVDQRWMDYVPALFPHHVVDDPGYNVAYWNLHERQVTQAGAGFIVNGYPLRFYHFSGFSPDVPHLLSKHQGTNPRVLLSEHAAVRTLCRRYAARLRACGHGPMVAPLGHATLSDGTPIDFVMRRVFRREWLRAINTRAPIPPEPFGWDRILDWLNAPAAEAPRLSRYLFGLFQERADLQREFRQPIGAGAEAYLNWVAHDPWARVAIPEALRPARAAMNAVTGPDEIAVGTSATEGLNIAGYLTAELGVGEIARLITAAAHLEGLPVATAVNDRTLSRQQDPFQITDGDAVYPVTLVCANADEYPRAVDALPSAMRDARYRIGFWFWETERLPSSFALSAGLLDEIWVASDYVASAVRPVVERPVWICPVPVRQLRPAPMSRADFGLPEGFLFLFMFDFLSSIQRKNPIGLVRAFCEAFRPDEGTTLLIKSINGHLARRELEQLRAAIGERPDIRLVDDYLASDVRDALLQTCDCYVSLHRSEGYGLTMAEAMTLGKPTIATGYSGNLTFMTPDNSYLVPCTRVMVPVDGGPYPAGDWWGEPDLDAAAAIMRGVYDNPALARERGERGRTEVIERCSPARTVAFVRDRLAAILQPPVADVEPVVADPEPVFVPAPVTVEPETGEAPAEVPRPMGLDAGALEELYAKLKDAERDAAEAEAMIRDGIPFVTPSRFGWPGRVLRAVVLRLLRPYANFQARAHHLHLQSTRRLIESLRAGEPRADGS